MTKKDYIKFAELIKKGKGISDKSYHDEATPLQNFYTEAIIQTLKEGNPKFDEVKFRKYLEAK